MCEYTREELIEIVKRIKGLAGFKDVRLLRAYLEGARLVKADLRRTNLAKVDLKKINLMQVNLSEANLMGADLQGANLCGAILDGANFAGANLSGANLRGVSLRGANLKEAKLWGVDLVASNLLGANLRRAVLDGANLIGSNLDGTDLRKANLERADLRGVVLRGADIREVRLWGANLWEADLRGADLRGAELCSAIFKQADLRGVDISGSNIWGIIHNEWKIAGINADYVYNCSTPWVGGAKEQTRQDFGPGEFERIFKTLPVIEIRFAGDPSPLDYVKLTGTIELLARENPNFNLEIKSVETLGRNTIMCVTVSRDEYIERAINLISKSWRDSEFGQRLINLLRGEYGMQLAPDSDQRIFSMFDSEKMTINIIRQSGSVQCNQEMRVIGKKKELFRKEEENTGAYKFSDKNLGIGSKEKVNYNIRQAVADALIVELSEDETNLAELLENLIKSDKPGKSSSIWE